MRLPTLIWVGFFLLQIREILRKKQMDIVNGHSNGHSF